MINPVRPHLLLLPSDFCGCFSFRVFDIFFIASLLSAHISLSVTAMFCFSPSSAPNHHQTVFGSLHDLGCWLFSPHHLACLTALYFWYFSHIVCTTLHNSSLLGSFSSLPTKPSVSLARLCPTSILSHPHPVLCTHNFPTFVFFFFNFYYSLPVPLLFWLQFAFPPLLFPL